MNPEQPANDERVATVVGDRLCAGCGFNLTGQTIVRERHYRMLMVRCPECSAVAALQEYPLLGRWANRWATLLAAAWFVALLLALAGSAAVNFGMANGVTLAALTDYNSVVMERHYEWVEQDETRKARVAQFGFGGRSSPWIDEAWWKAQDKPALLRQAGGLASLVNKDVVWIQGWAIVLAAVIGVFWSVALLHARKRWLPLFLLVIVGASALITGIAFLSASGSVWIGSGMIWVRDASWREIGPRVIGASLLLTWPAMCLGAYIGRPVVRWMVRVLLPPRLRGSLSLLWLSEGLTPPRP